MGMSLSLVKKRIDEYFEKYGDTECNVYDITPILPSSRKKVLDKLVKNEPPRILFRLENFKTF